MSINNSDLPDFFTPPVFLWHEKEGISALNKPAVDLYEKCSTELRNEINKHLKALTEEEYYAACLLPIEHNIPVEITARKKPDSSSAKTWYLKIEELTETYSAHLQMKQKIHNMQMEIEEISEMNVYLEKSAARAKEMAARTEEINSTQSEFLANMSHEIRTPMNGVIGVAEILRDTNLNEEQIELVNTITNSASLLLTIINDVLDYAKMEAGMLELSPAPFAPLTLFEDTIMLFHAKAMAKNVELFLDYSPMVPTRIIADRIRLQQIITNLIGNAIKFTHEGYIGVKVDYKIAENDGEGVLSVKIIDTGIGIPSNKAVRIFDKFSQADSSTVRKYGGTGLGLSICQKLINMMNGKIGVRSQPDRGSNFWFEFPAPKIREHKKTTENDDFVSRVLLLDPLRAHANSIERVLRHCDIKYKTVNSFDSLLNELVAAENKLFSYQCLIIHHHPPVDAFAIAYHLKSGKANQKLRIIPVFPPDLKNQSEIKTEIFFRNFFKPLRRHKLQNILLTNPKAELIANKNTVSDKPLSGMKILVVEDNAVNQMVAEKLLKSFGCLVDLADGGVQAFGLFAENSYDLILMDIQMPDMDGYQTTRALRKKEAEKGGETPIIALTAHAMATDEKKARAAGMNGFLTKPLDKNSVLETLKKYFADGKQTHYNADSSTEDPKEATEPETGVDELPDFEMPATLENLLDDPEFLQEIFKTFQKDIPLSLEMLGKHFADSRFLECKTILHGLKGCCANVGAQKMGKRAMQMEDLINRNKNRESKDLYKNLLNDFKALMKKLKSDGILSK
jgi:signal transduction histidine kinase/DNA-binding NarL/FixJ family response regulator